MSNHEISFNTKLSDPIRTRTDFTYKITSTTISIVDTGLGRRSVTEDIEAVLRKIEYWHQGSIAKFKIMCRDSKGFWSGVHWDGKTASFFALQETDDRQARPKLKTVIMGSSIPFRAGETSRLKRETGRAQGH